MDRNIKSKEEIQKMMALNEEINNLNVKICLLGNTARNKRLAGL